MSHLRVQSSTVTAMRKLPIPSSQRAAIVGHANIAVFSFARLADQPGPFRASTVTGRLPSARHGHAQAIVRRGAPCRLCWVRIFQPKSQATRPLLRADGITGFRNDAIMPVICPTGQVAFPAAGGRLLCMGLFSIFWQRAPSKGEGHHAAIGSLHNLSLLFAPRWPKIVPHDDGPMPSEPCGDTT